MHGLIEQYPDIFDCQILDVTETERIYEFIPEMFAKHGEIDVVVNNADYGLFSVAEVLDYENIKKIFDTNLTGSIMVIHDVLPFMGTQAQVDFFGENMRDFWRFGAEGSKHINYWLADNYFGGYYTRMGLSYTQREMITFCFLAAQGG